MTSGAPERLFPLQIVHSVVKGGLVRRAALEVSHPWSLAEASWRCRRKEQGKVGAKVSTASGRGVQEGL